MTQVVSPSSPPRSANTSCRRRDRSKWCWQATIALGLVAACSFAGYQRIFSTFAAYDDEGYIMISVQSVLQGEALYDEVYSQYGPGFFVWNQMLFGWLQIPLTHDAVRFVTLVLWLVAAAMAGVACWSLTSSRLFGYGSFLLSFFHLERLVFEPGHPNGLAVVLIASCIALATTRRAQSLDRQTLVIWGVLIGWLGMIKPNLGAFLALSLLAAQLLVVKRSRFATWAVVATGLAASALPIAVTRNHLDESKCLSLVIASIVGTIVCLHVASRSRSNVGVGVSRLVWFAAPMLGTVLVVVGWAVSGGTSLSGLAYGLVIQHTSFGARFYSDPPIYSAALIGCSLALVAAYRACRHQSEIDQTSAQSLIRVLAFVAVAGVALRDLTDTFQHFDHGADEVGHAALLASFVAPWVWVLLFPVGGHRSSLSVGRLTLGLIACLQPLGAYPNPGTQMAIGTLPSLLVCIVALSDMLREQSLRADGPDVFGRVSLVGLTALLLMVVGFRDVHYARQRQQLCPLDLPGATRLRLPEEQSDTFRWLASEIRARGDTFVAHHHAYNSLYFWAAVDPPTSFNATLWPYMLNEGQQARIARALDKCQAPILIRDNSGQWPDDPDTTLVRYLRQNFVPLVSHGEMQLLVKAD